MILINILSSIFDNFYQHSPRGKILLPLVSTRFIWDKSPFYYVTGASNRIFYYIKYAPHITAVKIFSQSAIQRA